MFKLVNTTSNIKDMEETFDLEHTMINIKNFGSNWEIKILE